MEQLQLAVTLWGCIGIAACIAVLCLLGWNKKRNPDFLTSRASPRDMLKARKIIIGFLGSFIIYALLFMFAIAHLAYAKIPMALIFSRNRFHQRCHRNDIVCLEKQITKQPLK